MRVFAKVKKSSITGTNLVYETTDVETVITALQDDKQDNIILTTNLTCNTLNATTITGTSILYGTTDVETVITALQDDKQDNIISTTDLTCNTLNATIITGASLVYGTTDVETSITALQDDKQDEIQDGGLTIAKTSGLQTELDAKQEIINEDTYLSCKRVSANQLVAFQTQVFDTIVLRRPTGVSGRSNDFVISFQELQCWVNGVNILASNAVDLVSLYALWTDKGVDIGEVRPSSGAYNNEFSYTFGSVVYEYATHSPISYKKNIQVALIIKQIPPTEINAIQSLVLYNRTADPAYNVRTEGLAIEFYNETNDSTFSNNLISTNVISSSSDVYRFDFKSIDSYTSGFVGAPHSTTNIPNDTYALKEVN